MSSSPLEPWASPPDPTPRLHEAWSHRGDLVHYARRILGPQGELAEDVVQESFLRLHEALASGTTVRDPRPWLFRVTRNLAVDERRHARRGDVATASLEVTATSVRGPLEVLQDREEVRQALTGIGSLPPRERRTVILDQAGVAPPTIARLMDTTTNAVHQSLFRARARLRGARAAAWTLLPLPVIRMMVRAAGSSPIDRLPALAPGAGCRFAGAGGLAGLAAAAVIGGGVVAERSVLPQPSHVRASAAWQAPAATPEPSPDPARRVRAATATRDTIAVALSVPLSARVGRSPSASRTVVTSSRPEREREAGDALDTPEPSPAEDHPFVRPLEPVDATAAGARSSRPPSSCSTPWDGSCNSRASPRVACRERRTRASST